MVTERSGGGELPPGLEWTELPLEERERFVSQKMADFLSSDVAFTLLDHQSAAFSPEQIKCIVALRNELQFSMGKPNGDGEILPELYRRGARRDSLEILGQFLGFRLSGDPKTRVRTVLPAPPMPLKVIREHAVVPNVAEANLLVGLNVMFDYLHKPLDERWVS